MDAPAVRRCNPNRLSIRRVEHVRQQVARPPSPAPRNPFFPAPWVILLEAGKFILASPQLASHQGVWVTFLPEGSTFENVWEIFRGWIVKSKSKAYICR